MTISGATRKNPIIANRLRNTAHWLSFGAGIFGWTAIQVQANMVDKQLQTMFHIDLVPNLSMSRAKSEEMSIGMSEGVGSAKDKLDERYNKAQRIILLEGRLPSNDES